METPGRTGAVECPVLGAWREKGREGGEELPEKEEAGDIFPEADV